MVRVARTLVSGRGEMGMDLSHLRTPKCGGQVTDRAQNSYIFATLRVGQRYLVNFENLEILTILLVNVERCEKTRVL
jgi:hypothetical protein